jgi:hypothetical protein
LEAYEDYRPEVSIHVMGHIINLAIQFDDFVIYILGENE